MQLAEVVLARTQSTKRFRFQDSIAYTIIKMLNRIHSRIPNGRAKSEDPADVVNWGMGYVPTGGFQWMKGRTGPKAIPGLFLVSESTAGASVEIPTQLYLQFAQLRPTPEAALEFANLYGCLGLVKRHFHSDHTSVTSAECWHDWLVEIQLFRTCWEGWLLANGNDGDALLSFLRKHHWKIICLSDGPWMTARMRVLTHINEKLYPTRKLPDGCFLKSCKGDVPTTKLSPFVSYYLNLETRFGRPSTRHDPILARALPTALLSALWLQFADLVTGSRVIRKCEKCHQWMDITDCARKGSKRMHERCSLAHRMARYRHKKNAPQAPTK